MSDLLNAFSVDTFYFMLIFQCWLRTRNAWCCVYDRLVLLYNCVALLAQVSSS